jgi:NAD+ kinase
MDQRIVGIVAHPEKSDAASAARLLSEQLKARGLDVRFDAKTGRRLESADDNAIPIENFASDCEMIVALGGDGLILHLAHRLRETLRPLFGLNTGRLGFLTCMHWSAYEAAADVIANKRYTVSNRVMLEASAVRDGSILKSEIALNDIVISRGGSPQLIRLQTWIGDDYLTEYDADGLIVATPTGSTAYSLAAGGPIVSPDSDVFVITPICPHVLTNRSVIAPDELQVTVEVEQSALASADGREGITLEAGDRIVIKKSGKCLPLVTLPDLSFYKILREKMRWAGSNLKPGQS